ncbi:TadE family type IV pilus minor pilin [Pseudonocardia xinjiangensis]|uniref:TadE family type IV pilus minor pilin n=1 Tax=Pseudonocardia xinjiangensis TaxID=75289 RepID=UPI003D8FF8C9
MPARTPVARVVHRFPRRYALRHRRAGTPRRAWRSARAAGRRARWHWQPLTGTGRREARRAAARADRGSVTVEAALALCSLAVFLAVAVGSVVAVAAAIRCIDAARELARLAARGEPDRGRAVAAALAPDGARLELVHQDDLVVVEVSGELLHPLPLRVSGRAVAALEPGATAP